ncbi:MAG TPA: hypothetical protein VLT82_06325 [Myxococcaceae bacterium]|nr:hypothetical protein [Myxococcaceae bacterium]
MRKTLILWLLIVPQVALGQQSVPAPTAESTAHRHLGFFLHLDIGVGYLSTSSSQAAGGSSLSGAALPLSIVIGGAVAEDWIIAGDLWGAAGPSPSGWEWGATVLSGAGLNVTHYFMPANVFVSLTPSFTALIIDNGLGFVERTKTGFGGKLAVGKEWWVSDHWGLGVAAEGFFAVNKDNGSGSTGSWTTFGGGLVFSATYN